MDLFKRHGVRTIAIYLLAFLFVALTIVLINPSQGGWPLSRVALAVAIVALVLTPIAILAHKWRSMLERSEVYHLKEYLMTEEELKDAVKLWVYIRKGQSAEGETLFFFNDEGEIECQYYLPQE